MKHYSSMIFISLLSFCSCSKPGIPAFKDTNFKIDTAFKSVVLSEIWNADKWKCDFSSKLNEEYFENDSLVKVFKDSANDNFWGRYYWHNDTLTLTANVGVLSGIGFIADIYTDSTARVFVNQCSHDSYNFKLSKSDTLTQCAKVPCVFSELKISSLPDSMLDETIYGFVRFKSTDYYYEMDSETTKLRTNMSFYFKACNYQLEFKRLDRKH